MTATRSSLENARVRYSYRETSARPTTNNKAARPPMIMTRASAAAMPAVAYRGLWRAAARPAALTVENPDTGDSLRSDSVRLECPGRAVSSVGEHLTFNQGVQG